MSLETPKLTVLFNKIEKKMNKTSKTNRRY